MSQWPDRAPDLLLLTFAAGSLDALSYLRSHAFTANMTGNTVLLGISLLERERAWVIPRLIALAAFVAGAAIGALVLARGRGPDGAATDLRRGVALELPVLIAFALLWLLDSGPAAIIAAAAGALGIQSVAVRRLHMAGVVTTFITGTITTALVNALGKESPADPRFGAAAPLAAMLVTYLLAAAAGALLFLNAPRFSCLAPLAAVAAVGIRCRS